MKLTLIQLHAGLHTLRKSDQLSEVSSMKSALDGEYRWWCLMLTNLGTIDFAVLRTELAKSCWFPKLKCKLKDLLSRLGR